MLLPLNTKGTLLSGAPATVSADLSVRVVGHDAGHDPEPRLEILYLLPSLLMSTVLLPEFHDELES